MEDMCVTQLVLHIAATTPSTELHSSTIEVTTLDRAFNLYNLLDFGWGH